MANIRRNSQELVNFQSLMTLTERVENIFEKMPNFLSASSVNLSDSKLTQFERIVEGIDDIYSVSRNADRQVAGDDVAKTATVEIPFFTLDKVIRPQDAEFLREFATAADPLTLGKKAEEVSARILRGHAKLHAAIMYEGIVNGKVYAPDKDGNPRPNLAKTYQSMFELADTEMYGGVANGETTIDLTDAATDPSDTFEKYRKFFIEKAGDNGDNYRIVALMGSQAFTNLKNHPNYVQAFDSYASEVEPLRRRLGGLSNNRVLEWQGVTYVEDISGRIADDKVIVFPVGIEDMFQIQYGPANTTDAAKGEEPVSEGYLYMFEEHRRVVVESDAAICFVVTRPELIIRVTDEVA